MTVSGMYSVLPADRNRRAVARSMREAVSEKPHVTLHTRADAGALLAARQDFLGGAGPDCPRLTITALLARLVTEALRSYPRINGRVEENEIRLYKAVHLGIAVALDDGLLVPVLRDAHAKDLIELATEIGRASGRARAGALKLADLVDATFTISNLGAYGVEFFTPIINPPQLAILGVGAMRDELRLCDGVAVTVPVLYLSLSFDHAVIDGAQAATFLQLVAHSIEAPHLARSDRQEVAG